MLTRLFVPRRRKNQQEVAGRAAEVIQQVLFDVGVDRFLNGTVLLDPQFRLRFYSAAPPAWPEGAVLIAISELPEAPILRACAGDAALDAAAVRRHTPLLADGLMRALLARSPGLRALPALRAAPALRGRRTQLR